MKLARMAMVFVIFTLSACNGSSGGGSSNSSGAVSGAALVGKVTDDSNIPLSNILIVVKTFNSHETQATTRTDTSGQYGVNVAPGDYVVAAVNDGTSNVASEWWTTRGGGTSIVQAGKVTVSTSPVTANFTLSPGHRLSGTVSDPATGAVSGIVVSVFSNDELVQSIRSGFDGSYRMSLPPGNYSVHARGQTASVNLVSTDQIANFSAAVSMITATIVSPAFTPVAGAEVVLTDNAGVPLSRENSNTDGTVTLYATTPANDDKVFVLVQNDQFWGSIVYPDRTELLDGAPVIALGAAQTNPLGTIMLPVANVLRGTVSIGGQNIGGINVQIRHTGTSSAHRFMTVKTRSDGTYSLGVPRGLVTAARLCAYTNASGCPDDGPDSARLSGNYVYQPDQIDDQGQAHFHTTDLDLQ